MTASPSWLPEPESSRGSRFASAWKSFTTRFEHGHNGAAPHLQSMEGMRGFAVFLVFLVHYATLVRPWIPSGGPLERLFASIHSIGNAGVDFFFVLSGFLIYRSLIPAPIGLLKYARRRARRIYPTFLAVFGLYLLLSMVVPSQSKLPPEPLAATRYVLQNLLLLPGVFPIEPVITVAWSLSYEAFYYLAMPALIGSLALRRWPSAWRTAFFIGLAGVALCLMPASGPLRLVMFLSGVLVSEALVARPRAAPTSGMAALALTVALLALAVPTSTVAYPIKVGGLFVAFFLVCFACFGRPLSWLARCFCWRPVRWLGNMSYSYYLIHGLTLKAAFVLVQVLVPVSSGPAWALLIAVPVFALTLVVSALLFLHVESRFSFEQPRGVASFAQQRVGELGELPLTP